MSRALFPISLSNQAFSSENVLPLLPSLFEENDHVLFLVADRLQIYNKALRSLDSTSLAGLLRQFDVKQTYLEQRNRWIERLTSHLASPVDRSRWSVIGLEDVADARCLAIFRNVMIAYYSLRRFRADVNRVALKHAASRGGQYPLEARQMLSRGYLLEEIALSVRLHLGEDIRREYYMGEQAVPVLRLYSGYYEVTAAALADRDDAGEDEFFEPRRRGRHIYWKRVRPATRRLPASDPQQLSGRVLRVGT